MNPRRQVPGRYPNLSVRELELPAQEIRWVIIGTVAKTGGHLAASLGAVGYISPALRV